MTDPELDYEAAERIAIRQEGCNERIDVVPRYPIEPEEKQGDEQ